MVDDPLLAAAFALVLEAQSVSADRWDAWHMTRLTRERTRFDRLGLGIWWPVQRDSHVLIAAGYHWSETPMWAPPSEELPIFLQRQAD